MSRLRRVILLIGAGVAVVSMDSGCSRDSRDKDVSSRATVRAEIGSLSIAVTNPCTVEADKKVNVLSELKYWASIVAVKEEGALVKAGDVIIEYECKALTDQIESRELRLDSAKLGLEQARKQKTIAEKQSEVDLLKAENNLLNATENLTIYEKISKSELAVARDKVARAKEALTRYVEEGGAWENNLKDAGTAIRMAQKSLDIERAKLEFKIRVNEDPTLESPYSETEIEGHAMLVQTLENALQKTRRDKELLVQYDGPNMKRQLEEAVEQAETDLDLMLEFTVPQTFRSLRADVDEAELGLDKAKAEQISTRELKEFAVKGKEAIVEKMERMMAELMEEKGKLQFRAQSDGIILYRPGWRPGGTRPIEPKPGEWLYPKAKLMEIPDMTTLMVQTELLDSLNIHLARGGKVGGGTKATFTLDAIPGRQFRGHVLEAVPNQQVLDKLAGRETDESRDRTGEAAASATVASESDGAPSRIFRGNVLKTSPLPKDTGTHFMKSGVSAYDVFIEVDWESEGLVPGDDLKPGMSGKVTLSLVNVENTLTVPVVSVYNRDDSDYCRRVIDGRVVEQKIAVGLRNESRVQVLEGLEEGDEILLVGDKDSDANPAE